MMSLSQCLYSSEIPYVRKVRDAIINAGFPLQDAIDNAELFGGKQAWAILLRDGNMSLINVKKLALYLGVEMSDVMPSKDADK